MTQEKIQSNALFSNAQSQTEKATPPSKSTEPHHYPNLFSDTEKEKKAKP